MNALTIYVCPQCEFASTRRAPSHKEGQAVCMGVLVTGTWVPEEKWPAKLNEKGMLAMPPLVPTPLEPTTEREATVIPEDGDDRYWDDEQAKAGR